MDVKGVWQKWLDYHEQLFYVRYRREVEREIRNEEDLFLLLCCSEMLGLPNPVFFYTLELYPVIYQRFHEWHLRMGMKRSPLDGIRCC